MYVTLLKSVKKNNNNNRQCDNAVDSFDPIVHETDSVEGNRFLEKAIGLGGGRGAGCQTITQNTQETASCGTKGGGDGIISCSDPTRDLTAHSKPRHPLVCYTNTYKGRRWKGVREKGG